MPTLINKLVADLSPGDKIHFITEAPWHPSPRPPLPLKVVAWDPKTSDLTFRAHRGKKDLFIKLNPALNVKCARRRVKSLVTDLKISPKDRDFYIVQKISGERLLVKELSQLKDGVKQFRILFAKDLWSETYLEPQFLKTLGLNWEIEKDPADFGDDPIQPGRTDRT